MRLTLVTVDELTKYDGLFHKVEELAATLGPIQKDMADTRALIADIRLSYEKRIKALETKQKQLESELAFIKGISVKA